MVTLYVTSIEKHAGKALITLGLIDRLRRDGLKVGFFKPMGQFPIKVDDTIVDKETWLIHKFFELQDPLELMCPVLVTQDLIMENFEKEVTGLREKIERAFDQISHQKDIVVVGCDHNFSEGSSLGFSGLQLVKILDAYALFVEKYVCSFCIDFLIELKKIIGDPMIGVVFNRVNAIHVDEINGFVSPFLSRNAIELYGAVPVDSILASLGIKDLATHLGADVVCGKGSLKGFVGDFLVGGMQVDKFITYLLKKPDAGIIVGGDRTDIQLVAIENRVKCLILSGSLYPNDTIIARAEANRVPILVARDDTYTVAKKIEGMVGEFSLHEKTKIERGVNLVSEHVDFEKLYTKLNL
ncbi:MAG: phosphotransacetylase family protein [Deltaproteobacteria bacterium]|nr:phosphotransacetylase family protein [Deltaproteobacteria bacterium]